MEENSNVKKKKRTGLKIFLVILAIVIIGIVIIIAMPKEPVINMTYIGIAETYSDETWFTLNIETSQSTFIEASSFSIMSNNDLITAKGFIGSDGFGYSYERGLTINGSENVILCFELISLRIDNPIQIYYKGELIT